MLFATFKIFSSINCYLLKSKTNKNKRKLKSVLQTEKNFIMKLWLTYHILSWTKVKVNIMFKCVRFHWVQTTGTYFCRALSLSKFCHNLFMYTYVFLYKFAGDDLLLAYLKWNIF